MTSKFCLILGILLIALNAFAGPRYVDVDILRSSDHLKVWTPPSSTDTLAGASVAHSGTGASSFTLNGMLFGNGSSAIGATNAGSQYQTFQAGALGVPTIDALHLDQAAAVTGILPVGSGGTGASSLTANNVILGNGASAVTFVAPGTSGNLLTSNGTTWTSSTPTQITSVSGSPGSPISISTTGITFSGTAYINYIYIVSSGGVVNVTANPQISAGGFVGQQLIIYGTSDPDRIQLENNDGLSLNGLWPSRVNDALLLSWDGSLWREIARR